MSISPMSMLLRAGMVLGSRLGSGNAGARFYGAHVIVKRKTENRHQYSHHVRAKDQKRVELGCKCL